MGLFERIRKKEKMEKAIDEYFKIMNAYVPTFTTFEGGLYEMELTRAAIHSFATHVSKLKPEVKGSGNETLERKLQYKPNAIMDTKKYLYRLATVYMVDNTAFIAPLYDDYMRIVGYYPLATKKCRIIESNGEKYLRYDFGNGQHGACELANVGVMNQFQYKDEFFGESNACMRPTMELINTQNQGIIEGVKSAASLRFIAKLANTLKPKDLEDEKKRFKENNLSSSNNGGVLLVDQKYEEVKQIDSKPFVVNPSQMSQIKENVYNYFGTNDDILQNKFNSEKWQAYYEGKIEPFAIEASLVHTNMTFSEREIAYGNNILFTANRLQYMSTTEKLDVVTQMFDRGYITHNQGLEIFNMSSVKDGDQRYIRKEYALVDNYNKETGGEGDATGKGEGIQKTGSDDIDIE